MTRTNAPTDQPAAPIYRHLESGVEAKLVSYWRDQGTTLAELIAVTDPKVPGTPFEIVETVMDQSVDARAVVRTVNGYRSEPLRITPEQLDTEWVRA